MRFKVYITVILFVLFNLFTSKSNATKKDGQKETNLLIVHSFDESLTDYQDFNRLIKENLKRKKVSANIRIFYLDCDSYDRDDEIKRIYNYIDTLTVKPDIILVCDDQATYSLLSSQHPIVKTTPIIFSGVNFPNWNLLKEYTNVTGIWDNPDYEKNIEMIEKLVGIKRVRFFYDKTYNGKRVISLLADQYKNKDKYLYNSLTHFLQYNDSIKNEINIENYYLKGNDDGERPTATSLYFINMRDELGQDLLWNISGTFRYSVFLLTKYDYTIVQIGRLATVPTFSAVNKGFGYNRGILGGYFTTLEEQADEACDYISQIVNGKKISQLPVKESLKKYIVDWAELNRWNIPVNKVPDNFEITHMPFYIKYKTEAIIFFSISTLFIIITIIYLLFLYRREAKRKRQAQLNLWEEKEFLSLALEGGNIFAWKYDCENDEFTFDKEFLDSVRINSNVVKLRKLMQMTHPEELEYAINTFVNVMNRIEEKADIRVRIDFNGNGFVWYEFRFLNVSGVLGDKTSIIGLVMDIQDFKNKEEELIAARDLASKAELKQSFLANMSHEIRTPLNAIVGFSNILVNDEDLPDEEKIEYICTINKNCELLLKLINDILEISRIESGNMSFTFEHCNLNEILEEIYQMCQIQTPSHLKFIKNVPEKPLYIYTDTMRLKQVIVNFVNNAFKFTASGYVSIGYNNDENTKKVCIYVEDTGEGIPDTHQKMIFDRFYKIDEFAQGTGLGLSICQVIANKLNGEITLMSEQNKGSRFGLLLPHGNEQENGLYDEDIADNDIIEESYTQKNNLPTVLIAEDSVSNYMVLNNILRKFCNIIWVINGKAALKVVRDRKVDLILMDIKMQEMDGITALKKIRKNFKNLPVIIQTAYAYEGNRELAQQSGASGFIAKPINSDKLLEIVKKFINIDNKNLNN